MEGERGGQAAQQLRGWWVENMLVQKKIFSPGEKTSSQSRARRRRRRGCVCCPEGGKKMKAKERMGGGDDDGTRVARRGRGGWLAGGTIDCTEGGTVGPAYAPLHRGKSFKGRGMAGQKGEEEEEGGNKGIGRERGKHPVRGRRGRKSMDPPSPPSPPPPFDAPRSPFWDWHPDQGGDASLAPGGLRGG